MKATSPPSLKGAPRQRIPREFMLQPIGCARKQLGVGNGGSLAKRNLVDGWSWAKTCQNSHIFGIGWNHQKHTKIDVEHPGKTLFQKLLLKWWVFHGTMFTDVYRRVANGTIVWSLFDSQIFGLTHCRLANFRWIVFFGKDCRKTGFPMHKKNGCPGNFGLKPIHRFDTLQQKRRTIYWLLSW